MTNYRPLESFAVSARERLIAEIGARLDAVIAPNSRERLENPSEVSLLERDLRGMGRERVVETAAYLWFNRFTALRYMDVKGYLPVKVVSPKAGGQPEILAAASRGEFPTGMLAPQIQERVLGIVAGEIPSQDRLSESYRLLMGGVSSHLSKAFPFLFSRDTDYSYLLLPGDLLSSNSIRAAFVEALADHLCESVEVIGWLYQFYVARKKDEVYKELEGRKATPADIPPATQIFTPRWMVEFLVDNSVAALWKRNNPTSGILDRCRFVVSGSPNRLNDLGLRDPQNFRVLDPACGSGHMLVYAFDILVAIYLEAGYSLSDVPTLILRSNLSGIEIDERAAELASLALTLKALEHDPDFLDHPEQPKVSVLRGVRFSEDELEYLGSLGQTDSKFWRLFEHASERGSLISPEKEDVDAARLVIERMPSGDLVSKELIDRAGQVVQQADVLSDQHHVCITNPPYLGSRKLSADLVKWLASKFTAGKRDLYAAFLLRMPSFVTEGGVVAAMTRKNWMFLSSYKELRRHLLDRFEAGIIVDPPEGSFSGAGVPICGVVLSESSDPVPTIFIGHPWTMLDDFEGELLLRAQSDLELQGRIELRLRDFGDIDGSPLLYWLGPKLVTLFRNEPVSSRFDTRQGIATADNSRFVRFWWEVDRSRIGFQSESRDQASSSGKKWFPYNKGGGQSRWFGQHYWVLNFADDGREMREFQQSVGKQDSVSRSPQYYFEPSVSWSKIGFKAPSFRYYPRGFVFDVAGMSVFSPSLHEAYRLLGYLNSRTIGYLLQSMANGLNFEAGHIARLPLVREALDAVGDLGRDAVALARADWDSREVSWSFNGVAQLEGVARASSLSQGLNNLAAERIALREGIASIQSEIDSRVESVLGIDESDLPAEIVGAQAQTETPPSESPSSLMRELLSWFVGGLFGRYSEETSPASELNSSADCDPLIAVDADGVVPIMEGGWFEDGADERFREVLGKWFVAPTLSENLRAAEELLGKPISKYFAKDFYNDHLDMFKKRPVYWMVASPKGSFQVLVYIHRLDRDTMSVVRNKYLLVMIARVQAQLDAFQDNQPREQEKLRTLLKELRDFDEQVMRDVAQQRIEVDLDDGVARNYKKFGKALKPVKELLR